MSEKAKGKQQAVDEATTLSPIGTTFIADLDDDLLKPPVLPTFLDHIEVDTIESSTSSAWLKISINYPSAQYTVGRVLKHIISALQQPLLRGKIQACKGLGSIEETMTNFYLSIDDPRERKDLMEAIAKAKLSPFRQLTAESSPIPLETSTSLPIIGLVDLLETLISENHETSATHDAACAPRSSLPLPSEENPRGSLLSRMAIIQEDEETYSPSPQERRRSIIRIRQKAYGRWVKALRRIEQLSLEERAAKREIIVNEFRAKRGQWADIISRLGGSFQETWGGVPDVLQPFV
jgi:hypothetical protein